MRDGSRYLYNCFNNKKNMEQLNPQPFPMRPLNMPPLGGQPGMMQPPFPGAFPNMRPQPAFSYPEQDEKKKEFARGIFVSGFEKCVTTAMIQKHFSIKQINGLKHPMTKFKESKGFAFIYYGSEDDAMYVKKTLDRTAILKDKIRITRTVISENLSKMMFKLKTHGLAEKEIQENETRYFGDQNLEKEVERIIKPSFGTTVEVNKITIPRSKADKRPLRYARVFFYVSDVKEARNIAEKVIKGNQNFTYSTDGKNQYEVILNCISELINADDLFKKYAKSEIYQYTKKNQSNVLHLKGVKHRAGEDPEALAEEIKEFIQKQGPQWNIVNTYAAVNEQRGAWSNLTFATYEETLQAYEHLKTLRPKFRDNVLFGSMRNMKESRTVVISVVREDATEKDVEKFLNELASKSVKTPTLAGQQPIRKYDYFSFNIIESKKFFKIDGDDTKAVTEAQKDQIHPSWIQINEVPRRLIIHFFHDFNEEDIKQLNNDITVTPGYEAIFMKGNRSLRSNHQKGHINKDGVYIKHTESRKKKPRAPKNDKPRRPMLDGGMRVQQGRGRQNEIGIGGAPINRGGPRIPNLTNINLGGTGGFRPAIGSLNSMGSVPPPNIPAPSMRAPQFMPAPNNMPPNFLPGQGNMPPAGNMPPPSYLPPSNMPPQGNMPPGMGRLPPSNMPPGMMGRPPMNFPPGPFPPQGNVAKPAQPPPNTE